MASLGAQWYRICLQCRRYRRHWFNPWVGKIPLEKGTATHSSILARESHGQRSLVGYELHMTE